MKIESKTKYVNDRYKINRNLQEDNDTKNLRRMTKNPEKIRQINALEGKDLNESTKKSNK